MKTRGKAFRLVPVVFGLVAATSVALLSGWLSHDALGYEWSDIREAALMGATLGTFVYLATVCQ